MTQHHPRGLALLSLPVCLLLAHAAFAQADQLMPIAGGSGGGQFYARCNTGEILNGFELRTGDDVDAIRPICAAPTSRKSIGERRLYPQSFGGTGGVVARIQCPDNAPTIAGMQVVAEGVQTVIINNIRLYCSENAPNLPIPEFPSAKFDGKLIHPASASTNYRNSPPGILMLQCPEGLAPVGIHGSSGIWLDSMGLICGLLVIPQPDPNAAKAIGRVSRRDDDAAPRHICESARDARARNSPAAARLEAQCRAAPPPPVPTAPPSPPAPITTMEMNEVALRGSRIAQADKLAAELRQRLPAGGGRSGFDVGLGAWAGQTEPGPGKLRYREMVPPNELPGFDMAAEYSLPRNRYAVQANVGATIARLDRAVARARMAEDDPFFWLGFDIASGIFGDRAAGAQGNTATGPGSLGIRNQLNAAGQRGFNAAVALHLSRKY